MPWQRILIALSGALPVTLVGLSAFGMSLHSLAVYLAIPTCVGMAYTAGKHAFASRLVLQACGIGILATGLYDLFRFCFLWLGLMQTGPIPHIGQVLGLHPAWLFGYVWRYSATAQGSRWPSSRSACAVCAPVWPMA